MVPRRGGYFDFGDFGILRIQVSRGVGYFLWAGKVSGLKSAAPKAPREFCGGFGPQIEGNPMGFRVPSKVGGPESQGVGDFVASPKVLGPKGGRVFRRGPKRLGSQVGEGIFPGASWDHRPDL